MGIPADIDKTVALAVYEEPLDNLADLRKAGFRILPQQEDPDDTADHHTAHQ